jgi:hypothetical protein
MAWRCDRLNYLVMHFVVESANEMSHQPTSNIE